MDRNTLIGLSLIALIVIGFGYLSQPTEAELLQKKMAQDSLALIHVQDSIKTAVLNAQKVVVPEVTDSNVAVVPVDPSQVDSLKNLKLAQRYGVFAESANKESFVKEFENDLVRIKISSLGARIISVELKEFKRFDSLPLVLFEGDSNTFRLQFPANNNLVINTDELHFDAMDIKKDATTGAQILSMRLFAGAPNAYLEYEYSLEPKSYMVGFMVRMVGMQDLIPSNNSYVSADWTMNLLRVEKSMENERVASTAYFKFTDEEVDYLSETEDEKLALPTKVKWIAFKQQFFSSAIIPATEFDKPISVETYTDLNSTKVVKHMSANFTLPYGHKPNEEYGMRFYFGPNHVQTLKSFDLGMEKLVPLGWGIFGWVNRYLVIPTFNFLDGFNMNYGLIIFILAVLIKLVLLPLTYKAYLSQAKMKVLKPEIDEINGKHKDDTMKIQQETMALYRKAGVNPLGGCLPLLLQLPILIAMFRFFPSSIELRQQPFLWATDLSTYDSIYDFGFNIPFYGDHISLFVILMTVSTILYTMMNNQMMSGGNSAMQQQMKWMGYIMPIIFMGVLNNYSSGLSYYYFLANMTGFAQQYLFRALVDEKAIHLKIQENKKKPVKKSGFQARLEEMAKQKGYKGK